MDASPWTVMRLREGPESDSHRLDTRDPVVPNGTMECRGLNVLGRTTGSLCLLGAVSLGYDGPRPSVRDRD